MVWKICIYRNIFLHTKIFEYVYKNINFSSTWLSSWHQPNQLGCTKLSFVHKFGVHFSAFTSDACDFRLSSEPSLNTTNCRLSTYKSYLLKDFIPEWLSSCSKVHLHLPHEISEYVSQCMQNTTETYFRNM